MLGAISMAPLLGLPHRGWPSRWSEFGWGECDCHAPDGPRAAIWSIAKLRRGFGGFVGLSENPACDIGECDGQASGAQVDPERVAAFGLNSYNTAVRPTLPLVVHRANQTLLLERVDDFRHGLFGQTGHLGKVRSRDGTVVQKRFENAASRQTAGHAGDGAGGMAYSFDSSPTRTIITFWPLKPSYLTERQIVRD